MTNDKDLMEDDGHMAEALNRLVRAARTTDEDAEFSAEDLQAFLDRRLSPAEEERVMSSLARSERLRSDVEFLAMMRDPEVRSRFASDAAAPPGVPVLAVRRRHPFRTMALAASVGVLLALLALLFLPSRSTDWRAEPLLAAGDFVPDPLRGDEGAIPPPADADVASRRAFHEAVAYGGGAFRVMTPAGAPAGPRRVQIQFEGAAPAYVVRLPEGASDVRVWFLSLPTLERRSVAVDGEDVTLPWPDGKARRGVATVTWVADGVPAAAPAGEVRRE